jgi:hypothetical protein
LARDLASAAKRCFSESLVWEEAMVRRPTLRRARSIISVMVAIRAKPLLICLGRGFCGIVLFIEILSKNYWNLLKVRDVKPLPRGCLACRTNIQNSFFPARKIVLILQVKMYVKKEKTKCVSAITRI